MEFDEKKTVEVPDSPPSSSSPSERQKVSFRDRFSKKNKKNAKSATVNVDEKPVDPLAHLPPHEQEVLRRQLEAPAVEVSYATLFRFSTLNDKLFMFLGTFAAIVGGTAMPLMTVVFGGLTTTFSQYLLGYTSKSYFTHELDRFTLYFVYLAIAEFVMVYIATTTWMYTGEHLTQKIREQYLKAILRQNIGFFDKIGAGEITTRITSDMNVIQDSISQKVALTVTGIATFVCAFVIGFVKGWRLMLILTTGVIAINLILAICGKQMVKWEKISLEAYAQGGTVAEEVLSSVRNATAFSTQDKLARQYDVFLQVAEKWGFRHKSMLGAMLGILFCIINMIYGLAFWQGSRYLVAGVDNLNVGDILTIVFAIIIGAFSLGNIAPHLGSIKTGVAAAAKIFATIERNSPLDPTSSDGIQLDTIEGNVELSNIKHIYPSRPEVVVMEDVSLSIPAGKTTALVGASGSGKSTIVGLVERFYDPVGGEIFVDGHNIRDINLQSLRRHISLVSQEPILFASSVRDNIAHGLIGTEYETLTGEKQMDMVVEAAKMANAHDFISQLPEKYDTNVGERGFLMSGGQKQRICIARAICSNPKILLLDEATSALDTKSEGVVQAALDRAAEGRTTIVIAHRLSTIKNSHNIVVMSQGRIVEQGTHHDLLQQKGAYFGLVDAQQIAAARKGNPEEDVEIAEDRDPLVRRVTTENPNQLLRTTTTKSVSAQVLNNKPKMDAGEHSLWSLIKLVGSFNKQDWVVMLIGLGASIIAGAAQPTGSILVAEAITNLSQPPSQYGYLRQRANFWAGMYLMLAFVTLVAYLVQGVAFAYCSEKLVHRARDQSFRSMLRQDVGFFDKEENTAGSLTSFLSTEATRLAGLSGATLGTILNVLTTLIASLIIALAIGWKLALVCISTVPILLGCGFLRFWLLARFESRSKKAYGNSASYACEATSAIRTVASLTREADVLEHYHQRLVAQASKSLRSNLSSSVLYAASQSFVLLCSALAFWYGGTLISRHEYSMLQFFIVLQTVIFGTQSAGTIFSFSPDMGKAKHAAGEMKTLFDRQPTIDTWSTEGEVPAEVHGALEFKDVHFRYPTRPEQPVLRGLNLSIKPGQYVALVGASGCGKSTTIGLLERFYDPLSGSVTLDGTPITTLNILAYRSHLALVSQEPTLYQGTIRDNILLGADHSDSIPQDEMNARIEQAARDANIWDFIQSLPDGFSTIVGNKGVMLSGGQKQRIAIARALLRNPKVLLLDEATSALDSESEKVVQEALDRAAKGRTTVAVAHRLSTVQKADVIFVFESGRVVEKGTHDVLVRKGGVYAELCALQELGGPTEA